MKDNLKKVCGLLHEMYPDTTLCDAVQRLVCEVSSLKSSNKYILEQWNEDRQRANEFDEKYSNALIKIRELNEDIERLKSEVYLYKSSMNHYKGITLKNKKIRDEIIESRDIVLNRNIEILTVLHEINPRIWEEVINRVSEKHKDECICAMPHIFDEEV